MLRKLMKLWQDEDEGHYVKMGLGFTVGGLIMIGCSFGIIFFIDTSWSRVIFKIFVSFGGAVSVLSLIFAIYKWITYNPRSRAGSPQQPSGLEPLRCSTRLVRTTAYRESATTRMVRENLWISPQEFPRQHLSTLEVDRQPSLHLRTAHHPNQPQPYPQSRPRELDALRLTTLPPNEQRRPRDSD